MTDESSKRSSQEIWVRLNTQGDQIAAIATSQAATEAKLTTIEQKFDDAMHRMSRAIETLSDKVNRPTNWFGMISALVGVITAMVGFVYLVVAPLAERDREMITAIEHVNQELENRAFQLGGVDKSLEWHQTWLGFLESQMDIERARNADLEERVSRMEGRQEMLQERIADIDNAGSRRWNQRQAPN